MENNVMVGIDAKLYNNIVSYCKTNGFNPVKYIEKTLRERIAMDKYGDLNEKFRKEELEKPTEAKQEVQVEVEKNANKPPIKTVVDEPLRKIDEKPTETAQETSEAYWVEENPVKKKRTLKSK